MDRRESIKKISVAAALTAIAPTILSLESCGAKKIVKTNNDLISTNSSSGLMFQTVSVNQISPAPDLVNPDQTRLIGNQKLSVTFEKEVDQAVVILSSVNAAYSGSDHHLFSLALGLDPNPESIQINGKVVNFNTMFSLQDGEDLADLKRGAFQITFTVIATPKLNS